MARTLSILVFAAAVLGFLATIVLSGSGVAIIPVATLAVAVFLFLQRQRSGYIAGTIVTIASVAGILMAVGGISTESAGFGDASTAAGHAMAIVSGLIAAGALLGITWTRMEPNWMPIVWLVVVLIGIGLVVAGSDSLGEPTTAMNYVAGIFVLASGVPALIQAIRPLD